ncbi:protein of unknown function (plasmid) [Magnetospirillum sp. XM-1]|uniref:hypothetical protein n=1 Tax=Magnetospirillum sp. XM-1 TaxID=1663591 RepID=UPI00073DD6DC|nr:hypothetical protein [Magnetospirillum sp. XM-1]CUW41868.1 protein of unknown function [Magnetospirillum sp. XM-1]
MNGGHRKEVSRGEARRYMSLEERISSAEKKVIEHDTEEGYAEDIVRLWRDAESRFLAIGRTLLRARESLKMEDSTFRRFVDTRLPFGYQTAYQLCKVAEAIDGNVLTLEEVPTSYATTYLFATMKPEELAEARSMAPPLLRPNVSRKEVAEFKRAKAKERLLAEPEAEGTLKRRERLVRTIDGLRRQRKQIDDRIAEAEAQLEALGGR